MPVKIRLMRIGATKRPFYRVVAVDERRKRTGGYLELLGTYNPLTEPKEINLEQDKIDAWIKKGAQMSDGFLRIIGKAPQRPPRKPKKEKKEESPKEESKADSTQVTEEKAPEETAINEAPAEETPTEAVSEEAKSEEEPVKEETVAAFKEVPADTPAEAETEKEQE